MKPPQIKIERLNEVIPPDSEFLDIERACYRLHYPNGEKSSTFVHDIVFRVNRPHDAVAIICYSTVSSPLKKIHSIYLRSAVRPAIASRFPEEANLWEIPAGLLDPGETPKETAAREALEEIGFEIKPEEFSPLGGFIFTSVGMYSERIYFFAVKVHPNDKKEPILDGSPLEKHGEVIPVELNKALSMVQNHQLKDGKTEIAIRRLAEKFGRRKDTL